MKSMNFSTIANYTSNVNTNYLNGTTGATNLKLIKDASGRTTGTAADNTTVWIDDGRYGDPEFTIPTTAFTIEDYTDLGHYLWRSDGTFYLNGVLSETTYTVPTGSLTVQGGAMFDGTTGVTERYGELRLIPKLILPHEATYLYNVSQGIGVYDYVISDDLYYVITG